MSNEEVIVSTTASEDIKVKAEILLEEANASTLSVFAQLTDICFPGQGSLFPGLQLSVGTRRIIGKVGDRFTWLIHGVFVKRPLPNCWSHHISTHRSTQIHLK